MAAFAASDRIRPTRSRASAKTWLGLSHAPVAAIVVDPMQHMQKRRRESKGRRSKVMASLHLVGYGSALSISRGLLQRAGVDRHLAQALAGCGKDRVGNRWDDGRSPSLAHSARRLGALHDVDVDRRGLVHAQDLVGVEVALLDAAALERDLAMERCR